MNTKDKLTAFMTLNHISQNKISKSLGFSQTRLNQYLHDKYPGDVPSIERKIERYLMRESERRRSHNMGGFVKTTIANELLAALSYCHSMREMGIAVGFPGNGKTETAKYYCEQYPETILVTAGPEIIRDGIVYALADALKVHTRRNKYHTMKNILDNREGRDDMVIVDEAQFLSIESLEVVRKVHDITGTPVFFIGQPRLKEDIQGKRHKEIFAQITSRMGIWVELPFPEKEDVTALCREANVTDKAVQEYCWKTMQRDGNSLRTVHKLLKFGLKYAQQKNTEMTIDMIEDVSTYMLVD